MNIFESYQKGIQNIITGKAQMFQILDSIQTSFQTFTKTFNNVSASLTAIDITLPSSRISKKNQLKEAKDSLENLELGFTANWNGIVNSLIPPPGLRLFTDTIVQSILNDIESIRTEYSSIMEPIEQGAQEAVSRLAEFEDQKKKTYAQYANLCKQINDACQKPDNSSEVDTLKSNYQSVLEKALEAHSIYEKEVQIFESKVEELFTQFEKADVQAFKHVIEILASTNESLDSMRMSLTHSNELINSVLDDPINVSEFESYFRLQPYPKDIPINYNPQHLPFNPDSFFVPKKLYENDLKTYKAKVITEYRAKKAKECDIFVGEIVYVLKKKGLSSKIFVPSRQQLGYVPSKLLEHYPEQCAQLMKVVTAYNDHNTGMNFELNQIVCVVGQENSNAVCITPYYVRGTIPMPYLAPL